MIMTYSWWKPQIQNYKFVKRFQFHKLLEWLNVDIYVTLLYVYSSNIENEYFYWIYIWVSVLLLK